MDQGFMTWGMLTTYTSFVAVVFMVVEFIKRSKWLKEVPNENISFVVSLVLLLLTQIHQGTFEIWDMVLYILTAMAISLGSNGLADRGKKKVKNPEPKQIEYPKLETK